MAVNLMLHLSTVKLIKAAAKAMEATFGKAPIPVSGGGSIPICSLFEKELGTKLY
jgi:hypothetical protein